MAIRPGLVWDALNRKWMPVDYTKLTIEQLEQRQKDAVDRHKEMEAQLKALLPVAASQSLLNKSMLELQSLLIKLAKQAPQALLGAV